MSPLSDSSCFGCLSIFDIQMKPRHHQIHKSYSIGFPPLSSWSLITTSSNLSCSHQKIISKLKIFLNIWLIRLKSFIKVLKPVHTESSNLSVCFCISSCLGYKQWIIYNFNSYGRISYNFFLLVVFFHMPKKNLWRLTRYYWLIQQR